MKTTKLFFMAALALMTAACSNNDNDILAPAEQPAKAQGITITAQLAPKSSVSGTRKVTEGTGAQAGTIVAEWEVNEHLAILYEKDGKQMADTKITAVDGTTGVATITFTVVEGTANNTDCQIIYPLSAAKDDKTGVKDNSTLLAAQDGTLNADLDVRVGAGTIQTSTPSLTVTTQPEAQFAIFKFTTQNDNPSPAAISVKSLTVVIGSQNYVITPTSATSTLYAALPAVSAQTVVFSAVGSDDKPYYFEKDGVTFAASKYYKSTLKMSSGLHLAAITGDNYTVTGDLTITGSTTNVIEFAYDGTDNVTITLDNVNAPGSYLEFDGSGKLEVKLKGTNRLMAIHNFNASVTINEAAAGGTLIVITNFDAPIIGPTVTINGGVVKAKTEYEYGYAVSGSLVVNGGTVYLAGGDGNIAIYDDSVSGNVTSYGWDGSSWDSSYTDSQYITTDNTSGDPSAWAW